MWIEYKIIFYSIVEFFVAIVISHLPMLISGHVVLAALRFHILLKYVDSKK